MGTINALPIGTILESKERQYKIEKVIGHGAFGITYQAETSVKVSDMVGEIWLKVCIKEFFMHDYNSRNSDGSLTETTGESILEKYKSSFTKEANNLARLDSRNIVKVLDVIHAFNTCYIVMEYISGSNLDDYIKQKGKLGEEETIRIAKEIAKAVGYMHSKKMLHLDLKPKNVMIDEDGGVHVIDFGLSKQYDNNGEPESSTTLGSGTEGYAPLEQGSQSDDEKYFPSTIDVYALGGTIFKMLTGEKPPSASTVLNKKDILEKKLSAHHVSTEMISLIKYAMQPLKDNRIPSMEDFYRKLNDIIADDINTETERQITDNEDTTIENNPKENKTKRVIFISLIFIFVIIAIGYFTNVINGGKTPYELANENTNYYNSLIKECSYYTNAAKTSADTTELFNAQEVYYKIQSMETNYSQYRSDVYNKSSTLWEPLNKKLELAAIEWMTAAKGQAELGNCAAAEYFEDISGRMCFQNDSLVMWLDDEAFELKQIILKHSAR